MQKNIDLTSLWQKEPVADGVRLSFPIPQDAKGFYQKGFVLRSDSAFDAMDYAGFALTVVCGGERTDLTVTVGTAGSDSQSREHAVPSSALPLACTVPLQGEGEHRLFLAWSDFPVETVNQAVWQFITSVTITGAEVRQAVLRRAAGLAAECDAYGKSAPAGGTARYTVRLYNAGAQPAAVSARQVFAGWESMAAKLTPQTLTLEADSEGSVEVELTVPEQMTPGGHEATLLRFVPNGDGDGAAEIRLQTMCALPHPYIYHDKEGWAKVAEKVERYPQFRPAFERWKKDADDWKPQPCSEDTPYCCYCDTEDRTMACAYLYAITGQLEYAEKLAQFFRYFTDERTGYPSKLRGCHMSYVQEGHFFQHLAIPYDIIHDAGVLTETDHRAIERTFRLYMEMLDKDIRNGRISNWVLSELTGALYCALAIQDWAWAERFAFGPCGTFQQFICGTFNDGWWHECSIGYNTWVSSLVLHTAHALRPFGVDLIDTAFPVPYSQEVSSTYACQMTNPPFAMVNQKWGGNRRTSLRIKDLFDAVLPFLDWRGVMFGVNDSDEKKIGNMHFGSTYDLAYTYYHDPAYIPVIRSFPEADPVFGHGELPEQPNDHAGRNACSDNIGLAMLRSQTPGREQKDQIQAVLHYGSHGGAHGHFDIGDLLSVMRCGRSLFNPECSWWGYRHFMYKWHVQNSLTKNMVNVDDKLQVPADSRRILFYSGQALQAAAIEARCQWAWPPYGGMDYDDSPGDFRKRLVMNTAWFPVDPSLPYAHLSGYTEPILQRRLLAVTDDYIVMFDWMQGEEEHQFETTYQFKGLEELTAPVMESAGHTDQYTTQPASDGQMITDCSWYQAEGCSVARFRTRFEADQPAPQGDRSNFNIPGELHADVYTAWPPKTTQITGLMATYIGWPADKSGYSLPLDWSVEADGAVLAQGSFDAWILGRGEVDIPLGNARELRLRVRQGSVKNEKGQTIQTPQGAFWGGAELTLADGSKRRLCDLPYTADNVDPGCGIGKDYAGGRVLIMGHPYEDAIPASPEDHAKEGVLRWDLSQIPAVHLNAMLGADPYPGDESQRRRFYAVRAPRDSSARFVTVLEPYESAAMVKSVQADSADEVTVVLWDGRVQRLKLEGLEAGYPALTLTEERNGIKKVECAE